MAENRDFLDEIIDMQSDLKAIGNPLGQIANALTMEPGEEPFWNPADYKEKPRAATVYCTSCKSNNPATCTRCVRVCPKAAIHVDEKAIEIDDTCIKCGLCVSVCPSECYHTKELGARKLYDRIAGAAASHERAYVTCTRALGRLPYDNEVVLPCVGVVPTEVWFSVMAKFDNVAVYLPLGICDRCRTTTGEETYCDMIARAETWAGYGLDLVVDEQEMNHEVRRSWQRKEFVDTIMKSGEALLARTNPVITAARRVNAMLKAHRQQLDGLQLQMDKALGATNTRRKRRILTDRRKLMMGALQKHPQLASQIDLYEPICDPALCTLCGKCEETCPTHAIELTEDGHWACSPEYCIQCGACAFVCPVHAIEYEYADAEDLVLPDVEQKDRRTRNAEEQAELDKLKEQGRAGLSKGLDLLESLGDALSDD